MSLAVGRPHPVCCGLRSLMSLFLAGGMSPEDSPTHTAVCLQTACLLEINLCTFPGKYSL